MRVVQSVDQAAWRTFVDGHGLATIFHTPEMFQVFERTKGCKPTLWATVDDDQQIHALFVPVQITVLDGLLRRLTTRAVAYGSLLCTPGNQGQEALALLLQAYRRQTRGSVLFTELRNIWDLGELQPALKAEGYEFEEHLNFLIDLARPQEAIWQSIRSNARRNIQKARKSGVVIEDVTDSKGVSPTYAILEQVYRRLQVPLPDRSLFRSAFDLMYPLGMFRVLLAKVNDEHIGALTLLIYNGMMTYWYTGTLREHAAYRAGDLLVWQALELGHQLGLRTFDFGGGGRPDEEYGVRDFKAKFGGELVNFGRNTYVHTPTMLKISKAGYQLMRRFL